MKKVTITAQMMIAVAIGVILGLIFGPAIAPVKIVGDIFLRLIQMSIVLLIMGQIIEAVGSVNPREFGKLGLKTVAVFLVSSLSAAVFGIFIAVLFKPGAGMDLSTISQGTVEVGVMGSLTDTVRDFFPSNVISAMSSGNILQVIIFSLVFGVAMGYVSNELGSTRVLDFIREFNKIILKMVTMIMRIAPLGILALIANTVGQMGAGVILPLVKYLWVFGLATLLFLVLWFAVTSVYCKMSFFKLARKMVQMSVLAMATTSSAVTLPTEMQDSREKLGLGDRVANLVLPLGMSLNSNGSAMHMAITVITISQIYGGKYGFSDYVYIAVMATLLSLANAVAPGADIVSLAMIVPQLGLPIESIAIFAGVGWFVGALRTILNVDSDVFTALLVAKSENEIDYDTFNVGL